MSDEPITFFARGTPVPGGSKRAFVNRHTGRVAQVDVSGDRVKGWRSDVRDAAEKVVKLAAA